MATITHLALVLTPSSSRNLRFYGVNKQPPSRAFFPTKPFSSGPSPSIRVTVSSSPITPIIPPPKPTTKTRSSTLTDSTRSLATLSALTLALTKTLTQKLLLGDALRFSLHTGGSGAGTLFFASLRDRPPGYLNTPLTVVAVGIKRWLDIYSGVLMVRVLLSWFPNIPWERQPLSAIRDLCDPYLNLFRNIIHPVFGTLDVSPLLAFSVLGTLGSIVHGSGGGV